MMKWFLFATACSVSVVILARPYSKDTLLDSIGEIVKSAVQRTTTTVAPNFVEGALTGGKDFVESQLGARKDEIMHTVGDFAEKVGVNRVVAETVGANLLQQGIKKGKELLAGRAVTENIDKAKEEAKTGPKHNKAMSGTGDIDVGNSKVHEVGDKSHTSGVEGGDNDVEPPAIMKKVDLKK